LPKKSDMRGQKVLVIDDDANIVQLLVHTFSQAGAQVYIATSGEDGLRQFYVHRPDLVILDVIMPEMNGWQVCSRIRQISQVPIIFLSAIDGEDNVVHGLNVGAVDYVTKPFSPQVLVARARAALRRTELASGMEKSKTYRDNYLTIDLDERRVLVGEERVKLTGTEFRLLTYLLENAGRVLSFGQILENVWGWEYRDSVNYVHVYVWHLRKKLEEDPRNPQYLLTEHGVGYGSHGAGSASGVDAGAQPTAGSPPGPASVCRCSRYRRLAQSQRAVERRYNHSAVKLEVRRRGQPPFPLHPRQSRPGCLNRG
jgi:two-component system KDP operon response regulator KdpE